MRIQKPNILCQKIDIKAIQIWKEYLKKWNCAQKIKRV